MLMLGPTQARPQSANPPSSSALCVLLISVCPPPDDEPRTQVSNEFQANKEPTIGAAFLTQKCRLEDRVLRYEIWDTAGQERFHSLAVSTPSLPFPFVPLPPPLPIAPCPPRPAPPQPMYYRNAQAAVVVYDVTKASSLEKAKTWVKELQRQANPNIVIALAGNKLDLVQPAPAASGSGALGESEDEADDATATPGEAAAAAAAGAAAGAGDAEGLRQVPREEAQAYAQEAGLLFFETSAKTGDGVVEVFTEIGPFFHFDGGGGWPRALLMRRCGRRSAAKKIPIEHILASSRGAAGRPGAGGGRAGGAAEGVNLDENQPKGKDACNC